MNKNKKQETRDDNILHINEKILKYFEEEKDKVDYYIKTIKEILKILYRSEVPYGVTNDYLQEMYGYAEKYEFKYDKKGEETLGYKSYLDYLDSVKNLDKHIDSLEINEIMYNSDIMGIIKTYKEIIKKPIFSSFMKKNNEVCDEEKKQNLDMLNKVIMEFNTKIEHMIEIGVIFSNPIIIFKTKNVSTNKKSDIYNTILINNNKKRKEYISNKKKICECIKKDENKLHNNENNSQVTCGECGTIYNINFSENNNFYDYSRITINQKYHYEKKCHFRDTINQYQGKQNKYIPQDIYTSLEEILKKHGLVNLNETDKTKRFAKVTKQHIRMFLDQTSNTSYYEDLHLIYSNLCGKPRNDISAYEKGLYEDFDKLVKVYLSLKLKRKNFLNAHYVLRQLLLRQGVRVPDGDLQCLKTTPRLKEHDNIYQRCCEILKWNFVPIK